MESQKCFWIEIVLLLQNFNFKAKIRGIEWIKFCHFGWWKGCRKLDYCQNWFLLDRFLQRSPLQLGRLALNKTRPEITACTQFGRSPTRWILFSTFKRVYKATYLMPVGCSIREVQLEPFELVLIFCLICNHCKQFRQLQRFLHLMVSVGVEITQCLKL